MDKDLSLQEKVNKLYTVLYSNGFAGNMKSQAEDLKEVKETVNEFKGKFCHFMDTRESTCPVRKTEKERREERGRSAAIYIAAFSSIISTLSVIGFFIKHFG